MNDRIGTINADGTRVWPEVTISGQAYRLPAHTLDIGDGHFIVYDVFPTADADALIAAARAHAAPRPARKRREHDANGTDADTHGF